jgi:hypothetical protein
VNWVLDADIRGFFDNMSVSIRAAAPTDAELHEEAADSREPKRSLPTSANTSRQIGAEETAVGGLVCEPAPGAET